MNISCITQVGQALGSTGDASARFQALGAGTKDTEKGEDVSRNDCLYEVTKSPKYQDIQL